jgi:hypothetical protein
VFIDFLHYSAIFVRQNIQQTKCDRINSAEFGSFRLIQKAFTIATLRHSVEIVNDASVDLLRQFGEGADAKSVFLLHLHSRRHTHIHKHKHTHIHTHAHTNVSQTVDQFSYPVPLVDIVHYIGQTRFYTSSSQ